MKSDHLEEETSVSKSFLLIFDYFTYFNKKNIELNLPKRKNIQKDKLNYQFGLFVTLKPRVGDVDNVGVGCCASPLLLNF